MLVNSTFPFGLSVNWDDPEIFEPINLPMQSWLLNTGSLTERLQALCNKFEVKVLGQKNVALDDTEISALKSSNNSDWQIREVILYGDDKPWVFARSVLPDHMCRSTWADLGTQPLGQRIFNDASFVRSGFEIGLLHHHPISRESFAHSTLAQATHQQMWARRSMFSRKKDTLLVAEAFLPDCPCYKVNK